MDSAVTYLLNRYRVLEKLGEGGMASVYKALDEKLNRFVAIKIVSPDKTPYAGFMKRFSIEAKALAQLNHPNIIPIYHYGEQGDMQFIVMEYLPGGTLKEKLGNPYRVSEAAQILLPVAQALEYAHKLQIIHRDIKPSNILFNADHKPILTDFGIAKVLQMEATVDTTGTGVVGTPFYMSPEQGLGRKVDERTDIYSLGVVFYELITGKLPFTGENQIEVILKQTKEEITLPKGMPFRIPSYTLNILRLALAPQPENRFSSMSEFRAALEAIANGKKPVLRSKQRQKSRVREKKRIKGVYPIISLIFFVLLSGSLSFYLWQRGLNSDLPPVEPLSKSTASIVSTVGSPSETPAPVLLPTQTIQSVPEDEPTDTPTMQPTIEPTEEMKLLVPGNISNIVKLQQVASLDQRVKSMSFSPTGSSVVVLSEDNRIDLVQLINRIRRVGLTTQETARLSEVLFSPSGNFIAGLEDYKSVQLWNGLDGKFIHSYEGFAQSIAFSPDDAFLGIGYYQDFKAKVFRPDVCLQNKDQCDQIVGEYQQRNPISGLGFSSAGDTLFVNTSLVINIWRVLDGASLGTITGQPYIDPSSIVFPNSGDVFYKSGYLVNSIDYSVVYELPINDDDVTASAFSPSGDMLAVATDIERGIWNTETGEQLFTSVIEEPGIIAIKFSEDGQSIFIGYENGVIDKWGLPAGEQ